MHRAFSKITEAFEVIAAERGGELAMCWEADGKLLRGQITMPSESAAKAQLAFLEALVAKAQEAGSENNLTITSVSTTSDQGISVILQIISDVDLDELEKSGNLDRYSQELKSYFEIELKKRRTRAELPFPELPANHEKNLGKPRLTKAFGSRVDPSLADKVDEEIERLGITKREAFEQAFSVWLDSLER